MFYSTAFLHEKYLGLNKAFMSEGSFTHPICKKSRLSMDQIWARRIGEASPISILTRPNFCRDIIPLEISRPWLLWARRIREASPIPILICQKIGEASLILTRPDFCRDIIPLEISCPYLVYGCFNYLMVETVLANFHRNHAIWSLSIDKRINECCYFPKK